MMQVHERYLHVPLPLGLGRYCCPPLLPEALWYDRSQFLAAQCMSCRRVTELTDAAMAGA